MIDPLLDSESMEKKRCSTCGDIKSVEEFYLRESSKDGLRGQCKACKRMDSARWREENPERYKEAIAKCYQRNPEKYRAMHKRWQRANLERCAANTRKWSAKNPDKEYNKSLVAKYGITLDDYKAMLEAQGGKCAMCGEALVEGKIRHPIDHDHGQRGPESVRGIVHQRCNIFLGFIESFPGIIEKATTYLEKHAGVTV